MSGRGERILWKVVAILSHSAGFTCYVPPPEVFDRMYPAPDQHVDPGELDEWLASVLEPDRAKRGRQVGRYRRAWRYRGGERYRPAE